MATTQLAHHGRGSGDEVSDQPLTHHEIMGLVAPFTRRGHAVDLRASDRARRRLAFRPLALAARAGGDGHPALEQHLRLELPDHGPARLVRTLSAPNGLQATLTVEGDGETPEILLEQLERVAVERQMRETAGVLVARSYRIVTGARATGRRGGAAGEDGACAAGAGAPPPRISRAEARIGEVTLTASAGYSRAPFDVELSAGSRRLAITEDFLAVVDWCWRPLRSARGGLWRGTVRLPVREPARTAALEHAMDAAVAHVAGTLARHPAEFHARHGRARWRVVFQRALPMLVGTGLLLGLAALALLLPKMPTVQTVLLHVPPLLMIGFFTLREVPTLEIPPFPRGLTQESWLAQVPPGGSEVTSAAGARRAG